MRWPDSPADRKVMEPFAQLPSGLWVFLARAAADAPAQHLVHQQIHDLYTKQAILLSILLAPVYMAGIWIGSRFFKGTSETTFRRVVVALVLIMGTIALVK